MFHYFRVSKNEMLGLRVGGNHHFPLKLFFLTVPKHFVEEFFCAVFKKFSGSEKVH